MPIQTILFHLCLFLSPGITAELPINNDAGFTEAIFDAQTIQELLDRSDCDGIRLYNTLNEGAVELMAVSISRGADMNGGLFPLKPYSVSKGIANNEIMVDRLTERDARNICEALHLSEHSQYSADFNKKDIELLLSNSNANALRIKPHETEPGLSMQLEAVNFERGIITKIGEGASYHIVSTVPCPPLCGSSEDRVFSPE